MHDKQQIMNRGTCERVLSDDEKEQASRRFRRLISAGLESGEARPVTDAVLAELRRVTLDAELTAETQRMGLY